MNDYQTRVIQGLQLHQENHKGISIPNWALDLVDNDFHTAIFLKQVVFWSTKTSHSDGFYKSYKDWQEESRLSRYHVQQAIKVVHELAGCLLITITKKKVNGAPTLFYKLDWEAFYRWICKSLTNGNATGLQMEMQNNSQMDVQESYKSLRADRDLHTDTFQTENSDFSSSPTPSPVASEESAPTSEKEEEISSAPVLNLDDGEILIQALADLCKVTLSDRKLHSVIQQIQKDAPQVNPADFRAFKMYYEAVRDKSDKYENPYPLYVLNGWGRFTEWWKAHSEDGVFGYLPGVEDSINLPRWAWASFEDWPVGEGVLSPRWSGVVFYAKQEDGTFAEVPREQWPEWAKVGA